MQRKLVDAIKAAEAFILKNQGKDGCWTDFTSRHHGSSTYWVTGYVGGMLEKCIAEDSLEFARRYITIDHTPGEGWGWNNRMVSDADSTAFYLLLLGPQFTIGSDIDFLLSHQNSDGGFSTYSKLNKVRLLEEMRYFRKEEQLRKNLSEYLNVKQLKLYFDFTRYTCFQGWLHSQAEITASAMLALTKNGCRSQIPKATTFLKNIQKQDGSWPSYWSTSDVYSTSICMTALKTVNDDNMEQLKTASHWLCEQQTKYGDWEESPFYTGWAIKALLAVGRVKEPRKAVNWLINQQLADGSWKSPAFLRIPKPSEIRPNTYFDTKKDTKRIFTTATCLSSLLELKENLH